MRFNYLIDTEGIDDYIARIKKKSYESQLEADRCLSKLKRYQINDCNYQDEMEGPVAETLLFISRIIGYYIS